MTLKTNSLSFRLIAGAAIWSVLCLVIGGFVLSGVFRDAVEHSFDDQLTFDLDGLIAAAEWELSRTPEDHHHRLGKAVRRRCDR